MGQHQVRSSSPQGAFTYPSAYVFTFSVPGAAPEAKTAMTTSVCQSQQTAYTVTSGSRSPVDDNFVTAYAQTTTANSTTRPGLKRFAADAFSPTSATFSSSVSAHMLPATSTSPSTTTTGVAQPPSLKRPTGLAVDTSVVMGMADSLRRMESLSISSAVRTPVSSLGGLGAMASGSAVERRIEGWTDRRRVLAAVLRGGTCT